MLRNIIFLFRFQNEIPRRRRLRGRCRASADGAAHRVSARLDCRAPIVAAAQAAALKAAETNAHSAAEGLALARRERDLGQVGAAFVLNAEQTYQQALSGRAQAEAGRYADTAALFQALGGGWWNRSETQP